LHRGLVKKKSLFRRLIECSALCEIAVNINIIIKMMRRLEITYHYILKSRRTPLPHGVVMGIFQHKVCLVVEHCKRFLFGTLSFFRKPDSLPAINFNEESMIWGATSKCDFALDWWQRLSQVCFTFIVHNMKVVYFLSVRWREFQSWTKKTCLRPLNVDIGEISLW